MTGCLDDDGLGWMQHGVGGVTDPVLGFAPTAKVLVSRNDVAAARTHLGLGRRQVHPLHEVEQLGAVSDENLRLREGGLVFTAGNRRVHFGRGLAPNQSTTILKALEARSGIPYSDEASSSARRSGSSAPGSSR